MCACRKQAGQLPAEIDSLQCDFNRRNMFDLLCIALWELSASLTFQYGIFQSSKSFAFQIGILVEYFVHLLLFWTFAILWRIPIKVLEKSGTLILFDMTLEVMYVKAIQGRPFFTLFLADIRNQLWKFGL